MKQRVKKWSNVPYGGEWFFTYPATGTRIAGRNYDVLMAKAKDHARANNLPIGLAFEDQVEDWVCAAMADHCQLCQNNLPIRPPRMGLADVLRGTIVALRQWVTGSEVVARDEAERRARICVRCPMNVEVRMPCSGMCPELQELVNVVVGAKGTALDDRLKGCGICHCMLAAAVWVPLTVQCPEVNDEMRGMFAQMKEAMGCWKDCQ